jgi:mycothiol synthase
MSNFTPVVETQYTYRPARLEDMPGVHSLLAAIAAVHPDSYAPTLADVVADFEDPWCNPQTDSRVALAPDGAVVAFVRIWINPNQVGETRVYLDDDIHPAHRHPSLEGPLLDWLEARGSERLREVAAGHPEHAPLVMQMMCWDTEHDRSAGYERRGFRPARHNFRMRRDLRQPLPERTLPAGLTIRNHAPALDEGMLQTRNESFSDTWHFDPVSPSEWQRNFVQRFDFRSDLSFAILTGDEVVAYSMNRFDPIAAERTGLKVGWIGSLGTRRVWRKRGLASALLVASMRAFQAAGLEYAGLGVDAANPTGALGLYEGLGFVTYLSSTMFHKSP